MSSILGQVQVSGQRQIGLRVVIAAAEKQGKTSMGVGAPDCLLVPFEQGFAGVAATHTPMIQDWTTFMQLRGEIERAITSKQFPVKSICFDSATAMERLIHAFVLTLDSTSRSNKALTMEAAHGGYGKAYGVANAIFNDFLQWCDVCATTYGINIIITTHVFSSKVKDPTAGEYDSFDVLLHSPKDNKNYGKREIITQWADIVGYLHEPISVVETNGVRQGLSRGQGRVLAVERTPAYTAGNRFGLMGVIPLPKPPANSWNSLADALYKVRGIDVYNRKMP